MAVSSDGDIKPQPWPYARQAFVPLLLSFVYVPHILSNPLSAMGPALHDFLLLVSFVFSLFSFVASVPTSTVHAGSSATSTVAPTPVASAFVPTEITHGDFNTSGMSYSFATQLPSVPPHPTPTFFVRQLDNSTVIQQSSTATSSTPSVVVFFMDGADTLSSRVVVSIIVVSMIFIACYVSLCCLWRCNRRPPPQSLPPLSPAPRRRSRIPSLRVVIGVTRTAMDTWRSPTATVASGQRLSSVSDATLTPGSGNRPSTENTKYSIEQGPNRASGSQLGADEIEMPPLTPPPAVLSRPRL
ncbi:hypothetical protein MSAN_01334000 [Mycena sanguinolenta]|uniref:Transmembrane protein n=1 Tax=Mycena sanguinolenta TaxID=230812 RepID=A0A8H6YG61_9AGAR|nr:hypothetical protein MSAN_01334000 [Mycena sanguinolenta]